ncbi:MAG: aminopeptidase P family protein [Fimbriimonas ginsengisoli]|uniref:Aminopeptidase P family protein n=1 Tax=Fimbriimonas ginsengisoli TaxID=1005039 RepID=A0A931LUH5_FIMGI|nr:aminopeptidase P family protein [Fimbriimonas ginsengisoli]
MSAITREKLQQAAPLVSEAGLDAWLTLVRETSDGVDPILPLLFEGNFVWQSALLVGRDGRRIAIAGKYDAEAVAATAEWDEVIPYVEGIREPLVETLGRLTSAERPRIGVNFSTSDDKADGLTHGMFVLLESYLEGTRFAGSLVSAEDVCRRLRARKSAEEVRRIRAAIAETDRLFAEIERFAQVGVSEKAVYDQVQRLIRERGFGFAWAPSGDPIVNSGPDSMIGHGTPSASITIQPGHIFHVDLGIERDGFCSDMQRCWYVPRAGESSPPPAVQRAFEAVRDAIQAAFASLRPGVAGWEVDEVARQALVKAGFPEYFHALGHQVGRVAHDGGAVLGPRWPRYGNTPTIPVEAGEIYTLEPSVLVEGYGMLGLEEMALVTESGAEWLTSPQRTLGMISSTAPALA